MSVIGFVKKIICLLLFPQYYSDESFIKYLRKKGMSIGNGTRFISPRKCSIDLARADYIKIGDNCCLSQVTLLAHDYSWFVFGECYDDILPDPGGDIVIGNNCFIGFNSCILKNTIIGDNVIIGAHAVVKGKIPSNTVWAGVPAKQICTLDEFYSKKKKKQINEALYRRNHIREKFNREPTVHEMSFFSMLFLERNELNYNKYIKDLDFNGVKNNPIVFNYFFNSEPMFDSFDTFLKL